MSIAERGFRIGFSILQILFWLIAIIVPQEGFSLAVAFLILSFFFKGICALVYYFVLARYMVGGKRLLYRGVFQLCLGLLLFNVSVELPQIIALYLAGSLLFSAAVQGFNAYDKKKIGNGHWKLSALHCGVIFIGAILCIIFMNRPIAVLYIVVTDYIYEAIFRIIDAFKPTSVVYFIQ